MNKHFNDSSTTIEKLFEDSNARFIKYINSASEPDYANFIHHEALLLTKKLNTLFGDKAMQKLISWRTVGTTDTIIMSMLFGGTNATTASKIAFTELATKSMAYYYHEKFYEHIHMNSHKKSLAKTLSWRAIAFIDTMLIISWFAGSWKAALAVATSEIVSKMILYYGHERLWEKPKEYYKKLINNLSSKEFYTRLFKEGLITKQEYKHALEKANKTSNKSIQKSTKNKLIDSQASRQNEKTKLRNIKHIRTSPPKTPLGIFFIGAELQRILDDMKTAEEMEKNGVNADWYEVNRAINRASFGGVDTFGQGTLSFLKLMKNSFKEKIKGNFTKSELYQILAWQKFKYGISQWLNSFTTTFLNLDDVLVEARNQNEKFLAKGIDEYLKKLQPHPDFLKMIGLSSDEATPKILEKNPIPSRPNL
jgi:uncharacterized membrane protein